MTLEPSLQLYLLGSLGRDVRQTLADLLVDYKWDNPQDIDWNLLMTNKKLQGFPVTKLKSDYYTLRGNTNHWRERQGLPRKTLTSDMLRDYLREVNSSRGGIGVRVKWEEEIVKIFEELVLDYKIKVNKAR